MRVIDGEFIFTTDGHRVILAIEDDGNVRVVLSATTTGENVYFNLSPADAHELGNKLRLAAKKAQS